MEKRSFFILLFLVILASVAWGQQAEFRKNPAISGIEPAKPLKMELKRDAQGRYSWSIQGSDVKRMIHEDMRFRAYVDWLEKRKKAK